MEVLATHVPDPNEEWMQFELSRLTQFTRIFPPEHFDTSGGKEKAGGTEDENGRDDEGDEDNDEDEGANAANGVATGSEGEDKLTATKSGSKAVPIEEILFQVSVQWSLKREFMLKCCCICRPLFKINGKRCA